MKSPGGTGGRAVVLVKVEELDTMLKILLTKISVEHVEWQGSTSAEFLVEEYVVSKSVRHNGRNYDPTMRVAFLGIRDRGVVRCHPFACYWKLPPQPIGEGARTRENTISSYSSSHGLSTIVSKTDEAIVYQQLQEFLPQVLNAMINYNLFGIENLKEDTGLDKKHKAHQILNFSQELTDKGYYELSLEYLKKVEKLLFLPNDMVSIYNAYGKYFYRIKNFEAAEKCYKKAIESSPANELPADAYLYLGLVFFAQNKRKEADEYFNRIFFFEARGYAVSAHANRIRYIREDIQDPDATFHPLPCK